MKNFITGQIKNLEKVQKDIEALESGTKKAIKNTVSDMKSRAPGLIAESVIQEYNIKKSEITPVSAKAKKPKKTAGSIRVKGDTIENLQIIYEGQLLTVARFNMDPKKAPTARSKKAVGKKGSQKTQVKHPIPYTISTEIKKGQRKNVSGKYNTPPFLASNGHGSIIPFQRTGKMTNTTGKEAIESIKTLSMPQMITNEKVSTDIRAKLDEGLEKRLEHNIKRNLGI